MKQDDIDYLAKHYSTMSAPDIAKALNCSLSAVYYRAGKMGLKKDKAFLSECGKKVSAHGAGTQFKKGQTPWNKGTGWSAGGRSIETRFKKGEMSGAAQRNYVPIGSFRITRDGTLEQKTTDNPDLYPARRWRPVAHLVWERERGPIPGDHVVRFMPGMHTNKLEEITIDRLECISRAENMRRNTIHRYPLEVKSAIRAVKKLTKGISEHEQNNNRSA